MNGKPKKIHLRKIENSAKVGIEGNYERPKASERPMKFSVFSTSGSAEN
jgi:hypothetical protein